jgi:hypothetical protein
VSPGCTVKPEVSEAAQLTASGDDRGGPPSIGALAAEIVRGDVSSGTNTSHTIVVGALSSLLDAVPADAPQDAYEAAALDVNVLGKDTDGARAPTAIYASCTSCYPTRCSSGRCATCGRSTHRHVAGHEGPHPGIVPAADVAYALLLGHVEGRRSQALFETRWALVLDQPTSHLLDLAATASQHGMLELRHAGGVIEVGFRELLRPFDPTGQ